MTNFIVENKHQKDVCHNEIVTCVQKVDTWTSQFPIRSNNQTCHVELEVSIIGPHIPYLPYMHINLERMNQLYSIDKTRTTGMI